MRAISRCDIRATISRCDSCAQGALGRRTVSRRNLCDAESLANTAKHATKIRINGSQMIARVENQGEIKGTN